MSSSMHKDTRFPLGDGNSMPCIGFGCYQIKDEEIFAPLSFALNNGYTHIDTAEIYGNEEGVGNAIVDWIKKEEGNLRESLFITTKLWPGNLDWGMDVKTFETTIESCQLSLKKLQLDYVDLYLIHTPLGGGKEGRLNQYKAMVECQKLGLCKSIGVSNFGISHLIELEEAGLPNPSCNQIEIHPFCQKNDIISYCKSKNITIIAYSSLAPLSTWRQGQQSAKTENSRIESSPFHELSLLKNMSESQILLKWALQNKYCILPKSIHEERILNNIDLFQSKHELSNEEMEYLNSLDRNEFLAFGSPEQPMDPTRAP